MEGVGADKTSRIACLSEGWSIAALKRQRFRKTSNGRLPSPKTPEAWEGQECTAGRRIWPIARLSRSLAIRPELQSTA